jgi:tricarballylate dehydrogenase
MISPSRHLVVVGQGAAGLAAALAAAEAGRSGPQSIRITLIDKAPEADAGGNTRWSPSNMRMAASDRVEPSFVQDMLAATRGKGDARYFETLAAHAPETVAWMASYGIAFIQPPYYLAKGPPRIQPVGGGAGLVGTFARAARQAGVSPRSWWSTAAALPVWSCRPATSARRCRPMRSCSPAAASRPTAR